MSFCLFIIDRNDYDSFPPFSGKTTRFPMSTLVIRA